MATVNPVVGATAKALLSALKPAKALARIVHGSDADLIPAALSESGFPSPRTRCLIPGTRATVCIDEGIAVGEIPVDINVLTAVRSDDRGV